MLWGLGLGFWFSGAVCTSYTYCLFFNNACPLKKKKNGVTRHHKNRRTLSTRKPNRKTKNNNKQPKPNYRREQCGKGEHGGTEEVGGLPPGITRCQKFE